VLRRYGEGGLIDNGKWSAFIPAGSATRAIIRSWDQTLRDCWR
jgi:hypothetical protein